ncbi:DUF1775 domain-containing protein [Microbacterium sp. P01]|uniref:DUF1775 domain-containing protein n=1 Tax=Microbacterium sp. P01 TaxID=3366261 RepID=UPI003673363D
MRRARLRAVDVPDEAALRPAQTTHAEPRGPRHPLIIDIFSARSIDRAHTESENSMHTTPSISPLTAHRRRARARLVTGITAGALLAIAVPLAASAHVHVTPEEAAAGATSSLTFSFSHGCDDSPTRALVFDIPEGVGNVTPVAQGGWTISRDVGSDGVPTRVTFSSDQPIESGIKATVSMDVLFDESTAGSTVAFPLTQECVEGSTAWTEIPAEGADDESVENPAPAVAVGDVVAEGDEHGTTDATADGDHAHAQTSTDTAGAASSAATADPVARWLAGGALAAGLAAVAMSLLRRRRP